MPRKHLVVEQINAQQQSQAKLWQKLSKEIRSAAKVGGVNPESNPRLKLAIEKALKNNLSAASIQKNIHGIQKNQDLITHLEYEVIGPENTLMIISALTDNPNRTLANLRSYLHKLGGQITKMNAVKSQFNKVGLIYLKKVTSADEEQLITTLIDYSLEHIDFSEAECELVLHPDDFYAALKTLQDHQYVIDHATLSWESFQQVTISPELTIKLHKLAEQIKDDDDLSELWTNVQWAE